MFEKIKNSKLNDDFIEFIFNLREEYTKIKIPRHVIDIHSGNIGITKNGDYVLFDF
jgi:putative component of toxin-antitoxin plasmid stabilization module